MYVVRSAFYMLKLWHRIAVALPHKMHLIRFSETVRENKKRQTTRHKIIPSARERAMAVQTDDDRHETALS